MAAKRYTCCNKNIGLEDLLATGANMGISRKKCMNIVSEVDKVVSGFEEYADAVGIRKKNVNEIRAVLDENRI